MPIIFQKWIYREDLVNNRDVLYLFGDNLERKGFGGQAKEMRGEPNAVGIATKKKPSLFEDSFFSDDDMDLFLTHYEEDMERVFDHIAEGGIVIVPSDGLGTGLSELPQRAPSIDKFIKEEIKHMREFYGQSDFRTN